MGWEKTVDQHSLMIQEKLKEFFARTEQDARQYHPFVAKVYSDLEEFVLRRGKRLASCSTLLTYRGYAGRIDNRIKNVCVGIEIYRHCILIHDDLVDRDNLRRGGNTLHKKFTDDYNGRFGDGIAVFSGNIAFSLAMRTIIDSGFLKEKVAASLYLLSKSYQEVNESQILDLLFEHKDVDNSEWQIMASKRAASLFKAAMLTGAILGGAPELDLKTIEDAAINLGYSFDIQDDIIDTFAKQEQYGRDPCGDVASGKKPLHIIFALNSADHAASRTLRDLIGKKNLDEKDKDKIRTLIRKTGGLQAAKQMSKNHAEKARSLISNTSLHADVKEFFNSFITYVEESLDWYN